MSDHGRRATYESIIVSQQGEPVAVTGGDMTAPTKEAAGEGAPSPAYVPQQLALEMLAMLSDAGMGAEGKPNTLWSMVREACDRLGSESESSSAVTGGSGDDGRWRLRDMPALVRALRESQSACDRLNHELNASQVQLACLRALVPRPEGD